tara:strand:- start:45 stop:572 length:528 start_codon:yes stop_codon:yes gene_type:complete
MQHEVILSEKYDNTKKGLGFIYQAEIAEDDLRSIEYDLNSQIPRLEKRKESAQKAVDTLQRKMNMIQQDNGSYIGTHDAYMNNQEVTGNKLQNLSMGMHNLSYSVELLDLQIQATKDFFKAIIGKDYVPYRSKPMSIDKKKENIKVSNMWYAKHGHKVDPVLEIGTTVPLENLDQ